jgi:hypothetical protein
LAGLADVLIPAGTDLPSASQAGVAEEGLDSVLAARPDLIDPLRALLVQVAGQTPARAVASLQNDHPAQFGLLGELVAGAYFLNPQVRASIGYEGQSPRPIAEEPDYLEDGLLESVIGRGPIYRPTPGR